MRQIFQMGSVAILNDLTDSLRYADITMPVPNGSLLLEVKSKNPNKGRMVRQEKAVESICQYLNTGFSENIYEPGWGVYRLNLSTPERNCRMQLNSLISDAYAGAENCRKIEDGLVYYVQTTTSPPKEYMTDVLERTIGSLKRKQICFVLNTMKYNMTAHYPYVLSINNAQAVYDFYAGKLFIVVLLDIETMQQRCLLHGLTLDIADDQDHALLIGSQDSLRNEAEWAGVGRHFFKRIACEFLSLDWFLEEIAHRFHSMPRVESSPA